MQEEGNVSMATETTSQCHVKLVLVSQQTKGSHCAPACWAACSALCCYWVLKAVPSQGGKKTRTWPGNSLGTTDKPNPQTSKMCFQALALNPAESVRYINHYSQTIFNTHKKEKKRQKLNDNWNHQTVKEHFTTHICHSVYRNACVANVVCISPLVTTKCSFSFIYTGMRKRLSLSEKVNRLISALKVTFISFSQCVMESSNSPTLSSA